MTNAVDLMVYKQYDVIKLKDGRDGTIVEILGPDYIVDVGSSPEDWETILVKADEIAEKE
ncbi:MAG: hypothetical protein IJX63_11740 [Lachnospiraceae bacterium]|nr:hypothetical protein [Lachnospiraceae bacterium]